jgi:hypothetical protein
MVNPPGWSVSVPAGWHAAALRDSELPAQFARWAAEGRVLVLQLSGKRTVWPLSAGKPVAGAVPLVAAARTLKPQDLVSFVESTLIEWGTHLAANDLLDVELGVGNEPGDELDIGLGTSEARLRWAEFEARYESPQLWLPLDKAFKLGLVDATQRRNAMAAARLDNLARPSKRRSDEPSLVAPIVTGDPRICLFVPRVDNKRQAKPMWRWPGGSVAQTVGAQAHPELVRCLAEAALWTRGWTLHRTMHQVWRGAFR